MTSTTPSAQDLPDIQSREDTRAKAIDRVGVSNVRHPAVVTDTDGTSQPVTATFCMTVSLPPEVKGTHMSRFIQVLSKHKEQLGPGRLDDLVQDVRGILEAEVAQIDMSFPWFINKPAPVTGEVGMIEYQVSLGIEAGPGDRIKRFVTVAAPATSLCPCSKEISQFGAHNQRCELTARIECEEPIGIAELGRYLESAASCEVFSVLKRPDEKYVTEVAYENPKFVEDIIRDLAITLDGDDRIRQYRINSENFESIHGHNAWAEIERSND
jgi:GTP cyclohydrolase FolE2